MSGRINSYSDIRSAFLKELFYCIGDDKIDIDLDCHISNLLDTYFHTIIDPSKYGCVSFSKIFNYYWQCYFTIAESVVNLIKPYNKEIGYYLDDDNLDFYKVLSKIKQFTKHIYNVELPSCSSYYAEINKKLNSQKYNCCGLITTNYYNLCKYVDENITPIYLNGQLSQFEFPEWINVIDVLDEDIEDIKEPFDGRKLFFPFIFGQSLVKPIVHSKQIHEYSNFSKCLNDSDYLIIIGYNMNSDDNHINSHIREFIESGKRIITISQATEKDQKNSVKEKLRLHSCNGIYPIQVDYTKNMPAQIVDRLFCKLDEIE